MPKQAPDTVEVRPLEVNALGITYQVTLDGAGTLAFESRLDNTCSQADIDELLARVYASTEKLAARAGLQKAKERVTIVKGRIELQEQAYARAEQLHLVRHGASRRQGDFRRTDAQQAELDNIMATIASARADLPIAEYNLARLQAIVDGRPPPAEPTVEEIKAAMPKTSTRPSLAEAAD